MHMPFAPGEAVGPQSLILRRSEAMMKISHQASRRAAFVMRSKLATELAAATIAIGVMCRAGTIGENRQL